MIMDLLNEIITHKKSALNDCFHFQGPTEKEQIDVQGDISYDIVEFITDTWPDVKYLISYFRYYVLVECVFSSSCLNLKSNNFIVICLCLKKVMPFCKRELRPKLE